MDALRAAFTRARQGGPAALSPAARRRPGRRLRLFGAPV